MLVHIFLGPVLSKVDNASLSHRLLRFQSIRPKTDLENSKTFFSLSLCNKSAFANRIPFIGKDWFKNLTGSRVFRRCLALLYLCVEDLSRLEGEIFGTLIKVRHHYHTTAEARMLGTVLKTGKFKLIQAFNYDWGKIQLLKNQRKFLR